MLIHRVLYPIPSLGPGERAVIWTQGCSKRCPNCISPEMQDFNSSRDIPAGTLVSRIRDMLGGEVPDGFTISGGDPFEQPEELLTLLEQLHDISEDILVYTGYEYAELQHLLGEEYLSRIRRCTAVLIDGRYIHELNDNLCPLRGSTNQNMIFFNEAFRERYEVYCAQGRTIKNIYTDDRLISVGIYNKTEEDT